MLRARINWQQRKAELSLVLRPSELLLFACTKRSNQEKCTPVMRSPGILPSDFARLLRGSLNARPCTCNELARIVRATLRAFLRTLAASQGPQQRRAPARKRQSIESCGRSLLQQGCRRMGPLQGAEHRRLCGTSPQGRGDGSPRLRSSAGMHCLSNPAKPRSAGDLERRSAEGALPGCVSFGDFSLHKQRKVTRSPVRRVEAVFAPST
jgi:hypothetical protein